MPAWNDWFHCMCNTYGTWLPGDPRGFRTRHHREHVDGDYKSPPPKGMYEKRHARSRGRLKRAPVILSKTVRRAVLCEFLKALLDQQVEVLAISVGGMHVHVLGRFPPSTVRKKTGRKRTSAIDDPPRHCIGIAKRISSKRAKSLGLADAGLWARRGKVRPIADRKHQLRVFPYVVDHESEGAAVWTFQDPLPWVAE